MSDRLEELLEDFKNSVIKAIELDENVNYHTDESEQALQSYIDSKIIEARIDELKGFKDDDNGSYYLESIRNGGNVQDRIKVLQAELRKTL